MARFCEDICGGWWEAVGRRGGLFLYFGEEEDAIFAEGGMAGGAAPCPIGDVEVGWEQLAQFGGLASQIDDFALAGFAAVAGDRTAEPAGFTKVVGDDRCVA